MNCQSCQIELGALLDDALTAAQRAEAESHLAHCAACRVELAEQRALKQALHSAAPPLPAASLDARVLAAFRQQHALPKAGAVQTRGWRAWLFGSLSVPKPALALAVLGVFGAVMASYKIGEIMGIQLPIKPPPVLVYNQTVKPAVQGEAARVVYVKAPGGCARPARATAHHQLAVLENRQPAARFETQASVSEAGFDFTTTAPAEHFEPVKDPGVRIIKGGNQ